MSTKPSKRLSIDTAARSSPLSKAQVEEIKALFPHIDFRMHWIETLGDKDRTTSLRTLGKTDFFTRELDQMLLQKKVRIAIHSAKDLPDPIPAGLCVAAVTKAIDSRDCLVLRKGESLKPKMVIATSSERREEAVRTLEKDVRFIDLRGMIGERLTKLEKTGEADGVVIAAAALLRLKLMDLNFIYLPGPTTPGQGQLAIVCREGDEERLTCAFST